jgi:hypothetical protein
VRLDHAFDLRGARATGETRDDALVLDEHERRHLLDLEPLRELGPLLHVDALHDEAFALLAREVREQALHPARRAGALGAEEDEQGLGIVGHYRFLLQGVWASGAEADGGFPGKLLPKRAGSHGATRDYTGCVGEWYWIGVCVGLGAAAGVLLCGFLAATRAGLLAAAVLGAAAGVGIGFAIENWDEALGGGIGALVAVAGAAQVIRGALRRGGTRGGTAALIALAAIAVAALAFVPALGYVEALALPVLAARLRRRAPERYAGLRTLARD